MNPYAYRRRKAVAPSSSRLQVFLQSSFKAVTAFALTPISPITAIAMVLFSASAVMGMTFVARSEMGAGEYAPVTRLFSHSSQQVSRVLGVSSYGYGYYNEPVCGSSVCLNYQLVGFDGKNWNARVDFYGTTSQASGSLRVNGAKFLYSINGNGSNYTGFLLKPGVKYSFVFYSGKFGSGKVLAKMAFSAPAAPITAACVYPAAPSAIGIACYYTGDPCNPTLTCQQGYGYQTPPIVPSPVPEQSSRDIQRTNMPPATPPSEIEASRRSSPSYGYASYGYSNPAPTLIPSPGREVPRIGQLVITSDGSVYLVTENGLLGFYDLVSFNSWCFSFNSLVPANSAENSLPRIGLIEARNLNQALPSWFYSLKVATCNINDVRSSR